VLLGEAAHVVHHALGMKAVRAAAEREFREPCFCAQTDGARLRHVLFHRVSVERCAGFAICNALEGRAGRNKIAHALHPVLAVEDDAEPVVAGRVAESVRDSVATVHEFRIERRRQHVPEVLMQPHFGAIRHGLCWLVAVACFDVENLCHYVQRVVWDGAA